MSFVIGLTGGVATGKTSVSGIFKKLGANVISADNIAHKLLKPGNICWTDIIKHFGKAILEKDSTIDRKKLGKIIFSNKKERNILNKITHPRIIKEIKREISLLKTSNHGKKIIVVEAPLLIEANALNLVDKVIVVTADKETQIKRLSNKKPFLTRNDALKIINSQLPINKKIKYADAKARCYIIDNNSTLKNTEKQVRLLYNTLTPLGNFL